MGDKKTFALSETEKGQNTYLMQVVRCYFYFFYVFFTFRQFLASNRLKSWYNDVISEIGARCVALSRKFYKVNAYKILKMTESGPFLPTKF